jgi:tetratricopeptide (TPR) repeat protein
MSLETELDTEIKLQLQDGIKLARAGDKAAAETVFSRILSVCPDHEDTLVWKAAVTEDRAAAVDCLRQALKLNPNNRRAQDGLEWAERRLEEQPSVSTVAASTSGTAPKSKPRPPVDLPVRPSVIPPNLPSKVSKLKNETNSSPHTYKKSRFNNQVPEPALPPEAYLPVNSKRTEKTKKSKGKFSVRSLSRADDGGVLQASAPKIAVTVSENVGLGEQTGYRQTNTVKVIWPLLLFVLALALALLTFLFSSLAPVIGVVALLSASGGVVLFNRAEF